MMEIMALFTLFFFFPLNLPKYGDLDFIWLSCSTSHECLLLTQYCSGKEYSLELLKCHIYADRVCEFKVQCFHMGI